MSSDGAPDLQAIHERFRAGAEAWARGLLGEERTVIAEAVESARRQGVPVVRGEMVAGVLVLEVATPAGFG